MIEPTNFAFQVTYSCPLSCAHCCFSAGPHNKDRLSLNVIKDTIKALKSSNVKLIAFTGGEPFLLGKDLIDAVAYAKENGFSTRVITSAFFAKDLNKTQTALIPLKESGLDELSISWDDYHEEFVSFNCISNAYKVANQLGIMTGINVVQSAKSRWTKERVERELGRDLSPNDIILESPLNLTGRAGEKLKDSTHRPERVIDPCPYVLTGPSLNPQNKLLACCGVLPVVDELILDPKYHPENLILTLESAKTSTLLNWLHLRGPYEIIKWICNRYFISLIDKNELGGNCEACRILYETKKFSEKLPSALVENSKKVFDEMQLLSILGLHKPVSILNLWKEDSIIIDPPHPK
ncbi:radical SAM protein [Pseudobacteroides cellulosolvens]|uniref:Radical SAM domain protein n=1 Tax=Pseudobacteroides cellulosolvens ATCC 35603 = DSM 2933 TaxID=398512 RepID=A0A0L6JKV7_9FIRM|nr:radical SAM protein [Pseudobacteroides cellulosolvens]KNY26017.1 Radical SAM domain protein [Pseudobacteroides cellulosolvens ATCC 35603 = DSM 2933]